MYKIIVVHDCAECPHKKWRAVSHTSISYCEKDKDIMRDIIDITTIQDWCPLEDYDGL